MRTPALRQSSSSAKPYFSTSSFLSSISLGMPSSAARRFMAS